MGLPLNTFEKWNEFNKEIEMFNRKIEETINKECEQIKASNMKIELDSKLAQEAKLNAELTQKFTQLNQRLVELDRICTSLESLTIVESDKNRLDNAKDMYQLAKELTGVRLDFSAAPNIAKGYVKNETRRLLEPFEFDAKDSDALWDLISKTSSKGWPIPMDKENMIPN